MCGQTKKNLNNAGQSFKFKEETSSCRRDSAKCFLIIWGLSFTVMTLKHDENEKENKDEQRFIE